jgi:hypothetical protein
MPWNKSTIQTLDAIGDVVVVSPITGEVLKWNGTNWVNDANSLGDLTNVTESSPVIGEILRYNGSNWTNRLYNPGIVDATVGTAGSGADFPTVQAAIAGGVRNIRLITSVTETTNIAVNTGDYVIWIDEGVTWTFDTDIRVTYSGTANFYLRGVGTVAWAIDTLGGSADLFDNGSFPTSVVDADGITFLNNGGQLSHTLAGGTQRIRNFYYRPGPGGTRGVRAKAGAEEFIYQNGQFDSPNAGINNLIAISDSSNAPKKTLFENIRITGRYSTGSPFIFQLDTSNSPTAVSTFRNIVVDVDTNNTRMDFIGDWTLENFTFVGSEDVTVFVSSGSSVVKNFRHLPAQLPFSPAPFVDIVFTNVTQTYADDLIVDKITFSNTSYCRFNNFEATEMQFSGTFNVGNVFSNFRWYNPGLSTYSVTTTRCQFVNGQFITRIVLPADPDIEGNQFLNCRFGKDDPNESPDWLGSNSPFVITTGGAFNEPTNNLISSCFVDEPISDITVGDTHTFIGVVEY